MSNSLVAYLLSSVKKYQDHVADLSTSSAEPRLARILLRLAHLDNRGLAVAEIPFLSHLIMAETRRASHCAVEAQTLAKD